MFHLTCARFKLGLTGLDVLLTRQVNCRSNKRIKHILTNPYYAHGIGPLVLYFVTGKFGMIFISMYLLGDINKDQLFLQLQTAIFQYAKRQMTWFRKMEKEGIAINWINALETNQDPIQKIKAFFS